jgi:hypothetical protein
LPKEIQKTYQNAKVSYLNRTVTVSFYFEWACVYDLGQLNSDIKTALDLGSAELGTILFAVPLGQLLIMPFQEN